MEIFLDLSAWILPVLLAVTLHEAAHGWVAEKFGDDTARRAGRISANPLKHVDPVGTVILPGLLLLMRAPVLFGYARPVPVDLSRLRPQRLGMLLVALAGPGTNVALALVSALLLHAEEWVGTWAFLNINRSIIINTMLAAFNMLPILPLDGGRVLRALLPGRLGDAFARTERFGMLLLLGVLLLLPLLGWNLLDTLVGEPAFALLQLILRLSGNAEALTPGLL